MPEEGIVILKYLNWYFSFVFNFEMILKLIALKGAYF